MPSISAVFLVLSLGLAVVIGAQTHSWAWGPAMVALAISVMAGLPAYWRRDRFFSDWGMVLLGTVTAGWFALRAWQSPVVEFARADIYLIAAAVGTYLSIRAIQGQPRAEKILIWGMALLLLANIIVVIKQISDSHYSPVFDTRAAEYPSGFYSHYNEAANYFIASSLVVAAAALFGVHSKWTRILWLFIAVAGIICIWFTRSRGGILGISVASAVFAIGALIIGKRQSSRWFAPALISIPIIGVAIIGFLWVGWEQAQSVRQTSTNLAGLLDNGARLFLFGIAISCIGLHPFTGGGSRSYSWECFQFIDTETHGFLARTSPELVHNEFLQAATDYGLIGLALLVILIGFCITHTILKLLFGNNSTKLSHPVYAWHIGGLAALIGMLVQSSFSFVFHLMPGIILLGIALGQISSSTRSSASVSRALGSKIILSIVGLGCIAILLVGGIQGSRITAILWNSHLKRSPSFSPESKVDALSAAIQIQPEAVFYQKRAESYQSMASGRVEVEQQMLYELAANDYERSRKLFPQSPSLAINHANILGFLCKDSAAKIAYQDATQLQWGMEMGFQAHFQFAVYLLNRWQLENPRLDKNTPLADLERAAEQIELSTQKIYWLKTITDKPRLVIHENLGLAYEASGDLEGAMKSYQFALTLVDANHIHYRIGLLLMTFAKEAWYARHPSEALAHFMEAKKSIGLASELPQGATQIQKSEHLAYLDQAIKFLQGAKVEASGEDPKLLNR